MVGGGKSVYDMYENGPSISNVAGIAGSTLGLAGNLKMKLSFCKFELHLKLRYNIDI